jgi:hypothetical protein
MLVTISLVHVTATNGSACGVLYRCIGTVAGMAADDVPGLPKGQPTATWATLAAMGGFRAAGARSVGIDT